MDINIYKNYELRTKDTLTIESEGITFSNENFIGKITYSDSINNGEDLVLGSSCSSSIQFELNNLNLLLKQLAGKQVTWQTGIEIENRLLDQIAKKIKSQLICIHNNLVFANQKNLTVWKVDTLEQLDFQDVPNLEIKSLFVVDNKLYCGHNEAPYLTVYEIQNETLVKTTAPQLNSFQIDKVKYYNQHNISFNKQGNYLKEYEVLLYNLKPSSLEEVTYEFTKMGMFILETPVKVNDTRIKVNGYDKMTLFDVKVSSLLDTIQYPTTLKTLLTSLCNYVGVKCITQSFINSDMQIKKNFTGTDVTGRQLLQYISEIACRFARITPNGELELIWYKEVDYTIDSNSYSDISILDYEVKPIDKLQVKVEENDIGVIIGEGNNAYLIENNPLLYAESDSELRVPATNIFNAIKDFKYIPYNVDAFPNPLIKTGDIITINTTAGQTIKAIVMNRKYDGLHDEYEATGNETRTVNQSLHTSIVALRGASNVLFRSIEETKSTITSIEKGLQSQITQNAEQISLRVTKTEYEDNNIAIGNRISSAESSIIQNANQIALKVSQTDYNGNTISSLINQTATAIKIQAEKVELSGYTTFSDLSGSGTTSINGANIQTGSIGADKIKTSELVVGTNIAMGSGAYISWSNVTGTQNVASKSDIPSDAYITNITEDTIETSYLYARNLEVASANIRGTIYADKVDAEDIVGGHISGSTLSTGGGVSIDSTGITFGYDSGEIYYGSGTFKFYSYGDCSFDSRGDIYLMPWNAVRVSGDLRISGDLYINNKVVNPTALLKLIEKMEEEE